MNVRVTGQSQIANALAHIRAQSAANAKFTNQISSGKRVTNASDNPSAFANILQAKASTDRNASYEVSLNDSRADLEASAAALVEVNRILARGQQLAREGANSDTEPETYETLADDVDSLLTQLVTTTNTQLDGRYLFGGTGDNVPPFRVSATNPSGEPSAYAYDGSQERGRAVISPRQTIETKYVGEKIFQSPGADVFQTLINLRDDFRNTTLSPAAKATQISGRIGDFDAAQKKVADTIGEQGVASAGLEAIQSRLQNLQFNSTVRRGDLEGADYAEAILRLREQETAFEATLSVTSKLLQPTLLDFLR